MRIAIHIYAEIENSTVRQSNDFASELVESLHSRIEAVEGHGTQLSSVKVLVQKIEEEIPQHETLS